jgi:ATP-binding cassette subfamily F protein uup
MDNAAPKATVANAAKPRKLSYKEQRELETLPELIASLEAEQVELRASMLDASVYADPARAAQLHARDGEIEDALMQALERWEVLSAPA